MFWKKKKKTMYTAQYWCVGCRKALTQNQVYFNDGVCPLCGRVSGHLMVEHEKTARLGNISVAPAGKYEFSVRAKPKPEPEEAVVPAPGTDDAVCDADNPA